MDDAAVHAGLGHAISPEHHSACVSWLQPAREQRAPGLVAAPAFGQTGLGIQLRLPSTVAHLVEAGYPRAAG